MSPCTFEDAKTQSEMRQIRLVSFTLQYKSGSLHFTRLSSDCDADVIFTSRVQMFSCDGDEGSSSFGTFPGGHIHGNGVLKGGTKIAVFTSFASTQIWFALHFMTFIQHVLYKY